MNLGEVKAHGRRAEIQFAKIEEAERNKEE